MCPYIYNVPVTPNTHSIGQFSSSLFPLRGRGIPINCVRFDLLRQLATKSPLFCINCAICVVLLPGQAHRSITVVDMIRENTYWHKHYSCTLYTQHPYIYVYQYRRVLGSRHAPQPLKVTIGHISHWTIPHLRKEEARNIAEPSIDNCYDT